MNRIFKIIPFILFTLLVNKPALLAQIITAPNAQTSTVTKYLNFSDQDPIYIFCVQQQTDIDSIDTYLQAIAPFSNPPYHFTWYKYDVESYQFVYSKSDSLHQSDTSFQVITGTDVDLFKVVVVDAEDTNLRETAQAWSFINNPVVDIVGDIDSSDIKPFNLSGYFNSTDTVPDLENINYFEPDTAKFKISANTSIEVCFTIDHDTLSQLGFYLYSPDETEFVELLPAISNWDEVTDLDSSILGCVDFTQDCDTGINAVDFCFSTEETEVPCVCEMNFPLSGSYAAAGDWSVLYGKSPTEKDWLVKFFDCNSNNSGIVKEVSLTFSEMVNGEMVTYEHKLKGASNEIETSFTCHDISDLFNIKIPVSRNDTLKIENPIEFVWKAEPFLSIPDSTTSLFPLISPYPVYFTRFTLTVTDSFGCEFWDTLPFSPAQSKFEMIDAFSPENNEHFFMLKDYALIRQFNIRIYNRWGEPVFESDDPGFIWKGTKREGGMYLPAGYYFYVIQAVGWDNTYKVSETATNTTDETNTSNQSGLFNNNPDDIKPIIIQKGHVYLWRSK